MTSNSPERWRPDARFLIRGGVVVFGIGIVVSLLTQIGAGTLSPFNMVLSGLSSVLVFLIICGLLTFFLHRIHLLSGLRKAAALAGVFFFAGALAWLVTQVLLVAFGLAPAPNWNQIATSIAISGLLAILFGTGFYLYEAMRQLMLESASRLKEAEFAEKELALARSIQDRLLPPTELSGEGYRIAARHLPARFVAGDFFDVFSLPDGALGLVVADVAGKGVGASPEPLSVAGPRMPLGLRRDQTYLATQATLSAGESLLLFSDGLPEASELGDDWTALLLTSDS